MNEAVLKSRSFVLFLKDEGECNCVNYIISLTAIMSSYWTAAVYSMGFGCSKVYYDTKHRGTKIRVKLNQPYGCVPRQHINL